MAHVTGRVRLKYVKVKEKVKLWDYSLEQVKTSLQTSKLLHSWAHEWMDGYMGGEWMDDYMGGEWMDDYIGGEWMDGYMDERIDWWLDI